jgi:hypothetical protein
VIQVLGGVSVGRISGRERDMDLRVAAAGALARMHTQPNLPYLAKLLTEKSTMLQAMGVGGLASFANNVPIGSHEPAAGP